MNEIVEQENEKGKPGRPKGSFKVVDRGSFLRSGKHELDEIIKKTGRELQKMVDVLVEVAQDTKAEVKERIAAADKVLKYHQTAVEQRNKDEITRKIAEIRVRGNNAGSGSTVDDDDMPELDFNNIHPDFRDSETDTNKES